MKKHTKHTKLNLRKSDTYAVQEIAILGVKCSIIAQLSQNIAEILQKTTKMAYFDASHNSEETAPILDTFTFNETGCLKTQTANNLNKFNTRQQLSTYDLVLINGNHYQAKKQIVVLDPEKEASITKRIDQITDVVCFVKTTKEVKIFDCLKSKFQNYEAIPVFNIDNITAISKIVDKTINANRPTLNGLVLAGGKSTRMGTDKGLLNYHGQAQRYYLFNLMQQVLGKDAEVFLSVRAE